MNSDNHSIHHRCPQTRQENVLDGGPFVSSDDICDQTQTAAVRLIGSDLTPGDYAALEARWIDGDSAEHAGLRRVDSLTGGEIIGRKSGNFAGILIPYFRPGSRQLRDYRLRRDQPDLEYDASGNLKPRQKYLSPPGRSNMLYLVPGIDEWLLQNVTTPVLITEGEFKTLALWRLANYRSPSQPRFLPIGVSGVYNWRGTIGKTVGPDGSGQDVKGPIPDLDWIVWQDRRVVIAYDADAQGLKISSGSHDPSWLLTCVVAVLWSASSNGT